MFDWIALLAVSALENAAEDPARRAAELLLGLAREHAAPEVEDDALVDRDMRRGEGAAGVEGNAMRPLESER